MRAIVDRFENGYAVLLFGDNETKVDFPVELLPAGAKEGSVLDFDIKQNLDDELQRRDRISKLMEKLKNKNND